MPISAQWPDVAGSAACGGNIAFLGIVHHHAVGIEAPAKGTNGTFHPLDPAARQSVGVTIVEERNEFAREHAIEVFAVAGVMNVHIGVGPAPADREAVETIVGFGPPSIEHGQVEAAIE